MPTLRFTGTVQKGKVVFDQPERWKKAKAEFEGKRVECSIGREVKRRSLRANALMWVWNEYIADWSGHSKEEIHEAMKHMFCPVKEIVTPSGEVLQLKSTRLLDNVEHSEYMSRLNAWAAENQIVLPSPEDVELFLPPGQEAES